MLFQTIDQLDEPLIVAERFIRVRNCEVVWANYGNLISDFGLRDCTETPFLAEVDEWMIGQCAWISEAQTSSELCNTRIVSSQECALGFRPPHYGRAAVFPIRDAPTAIASGKRTQVVARLVDVKGCGVSTGNVPELCLHKSGLLSLRQALRQVILQQIIESIFSSLHLKVRGVPVYAILKLSFDEKTIEGEITPAALLLRRAHMRPAGNIELSNFGSESHKAKLLVELLLRQYGLSSADRLTITPGARGESFMSLNGRPVNISSTHARQFLEATSSKKGDHGEVDVINIQTTRTASYSDIDVELVDFGHYFAGVTEFERPLLSFVKNMPLNFGGVFKPGCAGWTKPVRELIIDPELFAACKPPPGVTNLSQSDRFYTFVNDLAEGINNHAIGRGEVGRAVQSFVSRACGHLIQHACPT